MTLVQYHCLSSHSSFTYGYYSRLTRDYHVDENYFEADDEAATERCGVAWVKVERRSIESLISGNLRTLII